MVCHLVAQKVGMTKNQLRQNMSEKEFREWIKFIEWELNPESNKDFIAEIMSAGFKKGNPDV